MARVKKTGFVFPPEKELERVRKRIARSEKRTNIGLASNATPVEKAKYDFCQTIARYRRENNLTEKEIAKKLEITSYRLDNILYSHIDKFTLDELAHYASSLHIPFELRTIHDQTSSKTYRFKTL